MKKIILGCLILLHGIFAYSQSTNPLSIYEGERIQSVNFEYKNSLSDTLIANDIKQQVESTFRLFPQTQYSSLLGSYYLSQVKLISSVANASLAITPASANGIDVVLTVEMLPPGVSRKKETAFTNFPVLAGTKSTFVKLNFAASEMMYSNNNAWFAQPTPITSGNPLADYPSGKGYSAWLEGFASGGVYGIVRIVPSINLHVYGGANYLVSFSAGDELFTNKARIYGDIEESYAGFLIGGRLKGGAPYRFNTLYGRKQFVLGDGWLIVNTSMNGNNRASLQLNPRWASKNVFQTGLLIDKLFIQGFRLEANELPILNSGTVINGLNLELGNKNSMLFGVSFLQVPNSRFKYYLPDGTAYSREGLQVYNLRAYKSVNSNRGGVFVKAEGGYQRNAHFDMSAWAYYGELGWNFAKTFGTPSVSYRYSYFSGDDPESKSYNRWDALYTGGNGEQWVQGSNMYKMVQNSNEITHRLQGVINPLRKVQLVGQFWLFYAPQKVNLGGNPALSMLDSKYYGTEFNLTMKYFYSRSWYFHLNTAYTLPGDAIKNNVTGTKNWFCLSLFGRYSF